MNGYGFSHNVRRALTAAREEASRLGYDYIDSGFMLLGILENGASGAAAALDGVGVDRTALRAAIDRIIVPRSGKQHGPDLPYTSRAKKCLELAMTEARNLGSSYVGTQHLLIGILREGRGTGAQALAELGVMPDAIAAMVPRDEIDDSKTSPGITARGLEAVVTRPPAAAGGISAIGFRVSALPWVLVALLTIALVVSLLTR